MVLVTGDKGGVGKSFTSRTLLDWYLGEGKKVRAFDTDKTNSTLFRFYQEEGSVQQLDVESPGDLDELVNLLAGSRHPSRGGHPGGLRRADAGFLLEMDAGGGFSGPQARTGL